MRALPLVTVLLSFAGAAAAETVVVSDDDCRRATRHVPDASVAYQPGVDARGRAVAPADLPETPRVAVGESVAMPITVDLGRWLRRPHGARSPAAEAFVGVVEFHRGRFWFNGQPLESDAEAEIVARCREASRRR